MKKSLRYIFKTLERRLLKRIYKIFFGNIEHYGRFEIISRNKITGKEKNVGTVDNLIMDWTHNTLAKSLMGYNPITAGVEIKYIAIGDDNTAPTGSDSTLLNEVFRSPWVSRSNSANGESTVEFYILDTDYSGDIEEIGIFGGSTATGLVDTGKLIARALWSYTKTSSEEILVRRIDTFT